jgi:antirestriction protein ArdC
MKQSEVYEKITNKVLEGIDSDNCLPWNKPWFNTGVSPMNYTTKKPYRGFNLFVTAFSGFTSPYWMTANQIKKAGGKWSGKGTLITFWKIFKKKVEDKETGETTEKKSFLLKYYYVWNAEQIEGIDFKAVDTPKLNNFGKIEAMENVFNNMPNPPQMRDVEQDQAYYEPLRDRVTMPLMGQFNEVNDYYKVKAHEVVHSTGHKSRLNREGVADPFMRTKESYSFEELVAELGACFLMGATGLENKSFDNSVTYLKGWRNRIAEDPKLIMRAATHAQKAVDYIMDKVEVKEAVKTA